MLQKYNYRYFKMLCGFLIQQKSEGRRTHWPGQGPKLADVLSFCICLTTCDLCTDKNQLSHWWPAITSYSNISLSSYRQHFSITVNTTQKYQYCIFHTTKYCFLLIKLGYYSLLASNLKYWQQTQYTSGLPPGSHFTIVFS